jgi:hypothetical protein|tara:strand:- start:1000 stop:1227 length:228 start_codon:yes stop_codon:yes gene_type:complete
VTDNIVSLSDLIESRLRKEQELEYYQEALTRLVKKVSILQKEIDITNLIIDMIEGEKVMTIEEKISKMIEVESND